MKTKLQIKSVFGSLLFEYESEDNSIKKVLLEAVKDGADLRDADLGGANLGGANLGGANLGGANLGGANLGGANLRDADLGGANLRDADLGGADLRDADLRDADLGDADLRDANLGGANLRDANLRDADLGGANLGGANLRDADLRDANLGGANLRDANLGGNYINERTAFFNINCPEEGSFIGFKKAGGKIIKLLITEDAKRSSSTTLKCRASKVKVLEILNSDFTVSDLKEIHSDRSIEFIYKVGEHNEVENFDDNRWNECSTGIHFFMSKEQAKYY